jgi:hypothetical protein
MGNTFLIACLSFQKYFIAFFENAKMDRHVISFKSAVMFCIKDLKLEPLRLVPDGFSNRFNSFICL